MWLAFERFQSSLRELEQYAFHAKAIVIIQIGDALAAEIHAFQLADARFERVHESAFVGFRPPVRLEAVAHGGSSLRGRSRSISI